MSMQQRRVPTDKKCVHETIRRLESELRVIVSGSNSDIRRLRFEDMYRRCYNLSLWRRGRRLASIFHRMLSRATETHWDSRETFDARVQMLRDVFLFPIKTVFVVQELGIDVWACAEKAWRDGRRRASLRKRSLNVTT